MPSNTFRWSTSTRPCLDTVAGFSRAMRRLHAQAWLHVSAVADIRHDSMQKNDIACGKTLFDEMIKSITSFTATTCQVGLLLTAFECSFSSSLRFLCVARNIGDCRGSRLDKLHVFILSVVALRLFMCQNSKSACRSPSLPEDHSQESGHCSSAYRHAMQPTRSRLLALITCLPPASNISIAVKRVNGSSARSRPFVSLYVSHNDKVHLDISMADTLHSPSSMSQISEIHHGAVS